VKPRRRWNAIESAFACDVIAACCAKNSLLRGVPAASRRCASGEAETAGEQPVRGPKQCLVFVDRLLVTLVHLRLGLPLAALAECTGRTAPPSPQRSSGRPLLAAWGFAAPDRTGLRLRTLEDVFADADADADAEGVDLRIDGTEVQVRRPRAGRPGRKAFVSGKKRQNTIKTTTFSDGQGRTLFSGVVRPGRMHDQTAVRTEGIAEQFRQHPNVRAEVDEGYLGLANEFPAQVSAPPKKPKDDAPMGERHAWRERRRRQSSVRICVEHANAEYKQWRPLQRFTSRRETYTETHLAIAGLVRPLRPASHPPHDQYRTGARPAGRLLITHQPTRQAARPELDRPQGRNRGHPGKRRGSAPTTAQERTTASGRRTHP
jgi:DDE superfamily endonuclease